MRIILPYKATLLCCLSFFAPLSYAGFTTYSQDWPNDASSVHEKVATNKPAVAPADATEITYTDDTTKSDYKPDERIAEYKRLYGKVGLTLLSAQMRKMVNTSTTIPYSNYVLTENAIKENYVSWALGLGTKFD